MALPLIPIAAGIAGLGALYLVTRPSDAAAKAAAAAKAKAASGAAAFPPELQGELNRLLNPPADQDPAALETVATRLEGLGFKEQSTALRLKAAQLRAAQGAAPPAAPAPSVGPAPAAAQPKQTTFTPGVFDEPAVKPAPAPAPARRVSIPIPTRTLRNGMSGPDVKQWQEFLIFLAGPTVVGPSGADGIFGTKTQAATAAFQRSSSLVDDGVAGPLTYRAAQAAGY